MNKGFLIVALCLLMQINNAQDLALPTDFRQHNITEYNSSLLSPVFALDRNHPESIAFWSRWQWQSVDLDPSTLFLNYSRILNEESAVGIGFFQHNTGTYLHTGGAINYAYILRLEEGASISFGVNLFAFSRSLADDQFQSNSGIILPPDEEGNQFLMQAAPSLQFAISNFSIGIVGENLFDYNFTTNGRETQPSEKVYLGYAGYTLTVNEGADDDRSTYVRPMVYFKNIPGADNQYGLTTIYSTPKFWVQGGYNSFYGVSGGLGARLFGRLSIGALAEFGLDEALDDRDPSFEIVTAYYLGSRDARKKVVGFEVEGDEEIMVPEQLLDEEEAQLTDEELAIEEAQEQARLDHQELERQKEAERQQREQQAQDSIAAVRAADEQDPVLQPEVVTAEEEQADPDEKYEESTITKEGVAPGYYLIINVFGNQNYYNRFMENLREKGLNPGSFVRPVNNYNYVYLERYDTVSEARAAKRSRYNGRYSDEIWIFAVLPD